MLKKILKLQGTKALKKGTLKRLIGGGTSYTPKTQNRKIDQCPECSDSHFDLNP